MASQKYSYLAISTAAAAPYTAAVALLSSDCMAWCYAAKYQTFVHYHTCIVLQRSTSMPNSTLIKYQALAL